jgi:hypothetical protein
MPKLQWKLLTKKRASSTQGVPPGKESLAWVKFPNAKAFATAPVAATIRDQIKPELSGSRVFRVSLRRGW